MASVLVISLVQKKVTIYFESPVIWNRMQVKIEMPMVSAQKLLQNVRRIENFICEYKQGLYQSFIILVK
jgi:hypothetical protein